MKVPEIDIQPLIQELFLEFSEDYARVVNVEHSPAIKLKHFINTETPPRDQKSRIHTTEPSSSTESRISDSSDLKAEVSMSNTSVSKKLDVSGTSSTKGIWPHASHIQLDKKTCTIEQCAELF
ncbi:8098_t:CDS:2 [Ambispora leptoticha]|uniref:8098_t:CDS:1 n=1 Tax=Ambispora leptoticha TaxID=144679 RepID=A0A9N8YR89_9GLOM|nr:8098_t:CDS:2 [Ambispora leptoticha]